GRMNCVACNRPLFSAAIQVRKGSEVWYFGPVCARKRKLLPPRKPRGARIISRYTPVPVDPRQLALELHA
ncbi:MAG: hypothetical protein IIZ92_15625, partial [Aquincola sp.]|nr:hypothetical protein [Aquincola sp.]